MKHVKRLTTTLAGAVALAVAGGASAATFHAYVGSGDVSTATSAYGIGNTSMVGQPTPGMGALISQSTKSSSGMVGGFDARGNAGVVEASGGLNDQAVAGMQGYLHTRVGVNLSGYGFQVTPGFAVGYTSGITNGGNISRVRVTPALSIAYQNTVRLTYRQSPWSFGSGNNAPRDVLAHIYFDGLLHNTKGMGVLTLGAVIPDTTGAVSDGVVVALKTPRYHGFDVRASYVGGLQGNAPQGAYNPSRPWDSYNNGVTIGASYHFKRGVTVGVFEGSQSNSSGSMTSTTITQVQTQGREVGMTLSDQF